MVWFGTRRQLFSRSGLGEFNSQGLWDRLWVGQNSPKQRPASGGLDLGRLGRQGPAWAPRPVGELGAQYSVAQLPAAGTC